MGDGGSSAALLQGVHSSSAVPHPPRFLVTLPQVGASSFRFSFRELLAPSYLLRLKYPIPHPWPLAPDPSLSYTHV